MDLPIMPLYVRDWMADTQTLPAAVRGAYISLLAAMWAHGGRLRDDEQTLSRAASTTQAEWEQAVSILFDPSDPLLEARDGWVTQKRLAAEYARAMNRKNRASKGGRAKSSSEARTQAPDKQPASTPPSTPQEAVEHPLNTKHLTLNTDTEDAYASSRPKSPKATPDDVALAERLAERIHHNNPKAVLKPSHTQAWAETIRLMRDRDGHTGDEIRSVIEWCQDDEFWRLNILSAAKLRAKWNTLTARMEAKSRGRQTGRRDRIDGSSTDWSREPDTI